MYFINDTEPVSDKLFRENFDCADVERLLADFFIVCDNDCEIDLDTSRGNNSTSQTKFKNQKKSVKEIKRRKEKLYFGKDGQPEMYAPENMNNVKFHIFSDYKKKAAKFKRTLLYFRPGTAEPNSFFSSVVYELAYLPKNEKPLNFLSATNIIGQDKFLKLKEIEKDIILCYTQFGYFNRCVKLNSVLAVDFGYF